MNPVFKFHDLLPEMKMAVLSHMPPSDLIAFSETSKASYGLIHSEVSLVRKMKKPFCVFPSSTEAKDPHTLAQRAINLIPESHPSIKTEALTLFARSNPTTENFENAYEASTKIEDKREKSRQQSFIVGDLAPTNRALAIEYAQNIENYFFKVWGMINLDPKQALKLALSEESFEMKGIALMQLAVQLPECAEHICWAPHKIECYLNLARNRSGKERIDLLLKASESAFRMEKGCSKTHFLGEVWIGLKKLNSDKADEFLEQYLNYLRELETHEAFGKFNRIVHELKVSDIEKARKVAYEGDQKCCTYPENIFYRLISIAEANLDKNPEKANKILEEAIPYAEKIFSPADRAEALMEVARIALRKRDLEAAADYLEKAEANIPEMYNDGQKFKCRATISYLFCWIDQEDAVKRAVKLVNDCIASNEYMRCHTLIEIIKSLHHTFPEQAFRLLSHAIDQTQTSHKPRDDIHSLFRLAKELGAVNSKIVNLFFRVSIECADRSTGSYRPEILRNDATLLHDVDPEKSRDLFKRAIKEARQLKRTAETIAPLYPKVAAGLYQEVHEKKKDPAPLIQIASLFPEKRLEILDHAINSANKEDSVSDLKEIVKLLLEGSF